MEEKPNVRDVRDFDFPSVVIPKARAKQPRLDFFTRDIYDPLEDQYDAITCTETIEHLTDPKDIVRSLLRALSQKVTLIRTVPDGRTDCYKKHINFWSPESWRIFISRLGQEPFNVTVGIVQNRTVVTLRYNWVIFSCKGGEIAFQI